jgi:hypothetical protein
MKRNLLWLGLVVLALGAAASLSCWRQGTRASEDFPDGATWLCRGCEQGFTTSIESVAAWLDEHPGESMPCPQCRQTNTARAFRCPLPECRQYTFKDPVSDQGRRACPECRGPLP